METAAAGSVWEAPASPGPRARDMVSFLNAAPTAFHATRECGRRLAAAGFVPLAERDAWAGHIRPGGKYFFTRNMSTVVAFAVGGAYKPGGGFVMLGAHTDSPCIKLKPKTAVEKGGFHQLAVQPYGAGLWFTWFDRDLGLGGRVVYQQGGDLKHALVHVNEPLARIPSLAIHLDRTINAEGFKANAQTHLPPVIASTIKAELWAKEAGGGGETKKEADGLASPHHPLLLELLAREVGCQVDDIVDFELQLCDTQPSVVGGICKEFVHSGRIDNLASVYTGLVGLIDSCTPELLANETGVRLFAAFDHEEVGSQSDVGADSTVLTDTMRRVVDLLSPREEEGAFERTVRASYVVSADCAHAVHPNYQDKHEPGHKPVIHKGVVIKHNCNMRYATNCVSALLFRKLGPGLPTQEFVVRSDMACGSTIGAITASRLGVRVVDVGIPQWSMHSVRETCGTDDIESAAEHFKGVYSGFTALDKTLTVDSTGPFKLNKAS